jgi:hypothetical protein
MPIEFHWYHGQRKEAEVANGEVNVLFALYK